MFPYFPLEANNSLDEFFSFSVRLWAVSLTECVLRRRNPQALMVLMRKCLRFHLKFLSELLCWQTYKGISKHSGMSLGNLKNLSVNEILTKNSISLMILESFNWSPIGFTKFFAENHHNEDGNSKPSWLLFIRLRDKFRKFSESFCVRFNISLDLNIDFSLSEQRRKFVMIEQPRHESCMNIGFMHVSGLVEALNI